MWMWGASEYSDEDIISYFDRKYARSASGEGFWIRGMIWKDAAKEVTSTKQQRAVCEASMNSRHASELSTAPRRLAVAACWLPHRSEFTPSCKALSSARVPWWSLRKCSARCRCCGVIARSEESFCGCCSAGFCSQPQQPRPAQSVSCLGQLGEGLKW